MKKTSYEEQEYDLLSLIEKMRLTGENALDTTRRVIINQALARTAGKQKEAAAIIGMSQRVMNYWCKDLRLRPLDKEIRDAKMD